MSDIYIKLPLLFALLFVSFGVTAQTRTTPTPVLVQPTTPFPTDGLTDCKPNSNELKKRIWYEYGAVYASTVFKDRSKLPTKCVFANEQEIKANRDRIGMSCFNFGNRETSCLQHEAKAALDAVIAELGVVKIPRKCNSSDPSTCTEYKPITGDAFLINDDWAFRTYRQTVCNYRYLRVTCPNPAPVIDVSSIDLNVNSTTKPVLYRTSLPGTSQHHLGLAIDVNEHGKPGECDAACTRVMAKNGWYRTVRFDAFHFTYLGHKTSHSLLSKGLKPVVCSEAGRQGDNKYLYWVPNAPTTYMDFPYVRDNCRTANLNEVQALFHGA